MASHRSRQGQVKSPPSDRASFRRRGYQSDSDGRCRNLPGGALYILYRYTEFESCQNSCRQRGPEKQPVSTFRRPLLNSFKCVQHVTEAVGPAPGNAAACRRDPQSHMVQRKAAVAAASMRWANIATRKATVGSAVPSHPAYSNRAHARTDHNTGRSPGATTRRRGIIQERLLAGAEGVALQTTQRPPSLSTPRTREEILTAAHTPIEDSFEAGRFRGVWMSHNRVVRVKACR